MDINVYALQLTGGKAIAAILLIAIVKAMAKPNAQFGGKDWVARNRKGWADALGLPIGRLDLALKKLAELELIEKEQHLVENANILHVRPTPACAALTKMLTAFPSPPAPTAEKQPLPQAVKASLDHNQALPPDKNPHWSDKLVTGTLDPEKPGFINKLVEAAHSNPTKPGLETAGGEQPIDAGDGEISSPLVQPEEPKKTMAELAAILKGPAKAELGPSPVDTHAVTPKAPSPPLTKGKK